MASCRAWSLSAFSAFSSSSPASPVFFSTFSESEKEAALLDAPTDFIQYPAKQAKLGNLGQRLQAPTHFLDFETLRKQKRYVFRDFTSFFESMNLNENRSHTALIRGRRWGKSVFGSGWLAYLAGRSELFEGTAVEGQMRQRDPLIPVHLDLSGGASVGDAAARFDTAVKSGCKKCDIDLTEYPAYQRLQDRLPQAEPSLWNISIAAGRIQSLQTVMEEVTLSTNRQFALFIDEYDALVIKTLRGTRATKKYEQINNFMADFFTNLKRLSPTIPFVFVTGSSRLAIKGFWSGANNIKDLSFHPDSATLLGYTWEQIEQHYSIQLEWLQRLHGMTREQLRKNIEEWYNGHRWTSESKTMVFNPWGVDRFMEAGKFNPYWSSSGDSRLFDSKLMLKSVVRQLQSGPNTAISIPWSRLQDSRLPTKVGDQLDEEGQLAMLVGAGILSIHPDHQSQPFQAKEVLPLTIPNQDARVGLMNVLANALALPTSFSAGLVESLLKKGDIVGLLHLAVETGALEQALSQIAGPRDVKELLISQAFTSMLMATTSDVIYRPMAEVARPSDEPKKPGQLPYADHVFHIAATNQSFILEFKYVRTEPKPLSVISDEGLTTAISDRKLKTELRKGLEQSFQYEDLVKKEPGWTGMFCAVVFGDNTEKRLEAMTRPYSKQEAQILLQQLQADTCRICQDNTKFKCFELQQSSAADSSNVTRD